VCEAQRFEYLLQHVPLDSPMWTSFEAITDRLHTHWHVGDETILSNASAAYRDTVGRLEAAERNRNTAELDGPFKDARRDPEYRIVCATFAKRNQEIDRQLAALRMRWPKPLGV